MPDSITENPACSPTTPITTQSHNFNRFGDAYHFKTVDGNSAIEALVEADCLLAGVREILQTEASLDCASGGQGISNTHYMLLMVLDSVMALMGSAEAGIRAAERGQV